VSDEQQPGTVPTVRDRLAGVLSDDRVAEHLRNRALRLDGEVVDDLDTPAPPGTRIVVGGSDG
jgi:hypothetical protein